MVLSITCMIEAQFDTIRRLYWYDTRTTVKCHYQVYIFIHISYDVVFAILVIVVVCRHVIYLPISNVLNIHKGHPNALLSHKPATLILHCRIGMKTCHSLMLLYSNVCHQFHVHVQNITHVLPPLVPYEADCIVHHMASSTITVSGYGLFDHHRMTWISSWEAHRYCRIL